MLYRIDFQHFLVDMIDYFTQTEILHCQYLLLSAKVTNQKRIDNVVKASILWPDNDSLIRYAETHNFELFQKEYHAHLDTKETNERDVSWSGASIYNSVVYLVLQHEDVIIVCDREENFIVDAFCNYIKKHWHLDVIDLNVLFSKGEIGPYYIDRIKIRNSAVDIRRAAGRDKLKVMDGTRDGRLRHLQLMNKKEKIAKLKSLDIKVHENDNLDALLIDAWVNMEFD